ncbi:cbb3-type cytochrome c oxidase subunit I [Silvimonas amylolytica]|uniref:Membrane protein n=1 Tax=Silvimonas amylolytica TaxID=449663 RepID=A0ABQ2PG19_9NEIS|nr:cbb3-type cytochrome c oxidase subunit I [Silvimonas amylolytica]GGP24190.1 membrane protein [Silvimonas amylolytica]
MNMNALGMLLSAFVIAILGLMFFIWSNGRSLLTGGEEAASEIFSEGEVGLVEDPAGTATSRARLQSTSTGHAQVGLHVDEADILARIESDKSTSLIVLIMMTAAVLWLLVASTFGLISSIKLHQPDWLTGAMWLGFGVTRTIHLNAVAYGWAPMACLSSCIWILPRLLKTPLRSGQWAILGGVIWNLSLIAGLVAIATGYNSGLEWLEIPLPIAAGMVVGGAMVGIPLLDTLGHRRTRHLYVSVWYMSAALFWFPVLLIVAKMPVHVGIEQATANWWFGHNVLGLFYTPLSLATIYYLLPKIIGRPIENYNLSLLGFWTLAFFYGQVGGHHLEGSPAPAWLITLSIVQSMMMIIPVAAFTINQHMTMRGHFRMWVHSPTLRFILIGGMMYTLSSLQGSFEALRSINTVTHFTHFTVAHAHLGLYGFVTMVMFGAFYFILPRVRGWEWPYPWAIQLHFWLVVLGFGLYFTALTIGGVLQGLAMLDASKPFIDSVIVTRPWLIGRSIGGGMMTLGHVVFAVHVLAMVFKLGPKRHTQALFWRDAMPPGLAPNLAVQPLQQEGAAS